MEKIIDRTLPPEIKGIDKIDISKARKFTLDNGIPVYGITAGFQDLVKVEFIFPNNSFDLKNPLLHSATNRMLSEGTSKFSAQQLADYIDYHGAFYETDENFDYTSVLVYTLNKHFDAILPYFSDIIHNPIFPSKELDIYIQNNKQRLLIDNEKVSSVSRRKFNEIIFGAQHPYGYYVHPEDFELLESSKLKTIHKQKYIPSNCTIIISGLVKDESINLLNKFFGKAVNSNGSDKKDATVPFHSSSEKKHLVQKEVVQSALRIGKPFFNRTHPDFPGMAVLNTILGGFFGSRLMSNIREDKGYTYSIGSGVVSMKQEGYFFISTEVGAEVTNSAIEEIYKEIELLRTEDIEAEELEMAKNYMLGTFLKSIDGAFQLAERFKSIYLYGLDYSYYDKYVKKIRSIQPDELRQLAVKYLDPGDFYELVVGRK